MKCPRCGADMADDAKFCIACGKEVTDPGAMTVAMLRQANPGLGVPPDMPPAETPSGKSAAFDKTVNAPIAGTTPPASRAPSGAVAEPPTDPPQMRKSVPRPPIEEPKTAEDPIFRAVRNELADDYEVERELGRGGMAVVYRATERALERAVALKVLPPEMAALGATADRFKREARLAASLDHPNIIPVYRVGSTKNLFYMAMKFVEGRALDAIIESQGALPLPVVVRVLHDAASGLAYAHERGIVHRDIKGANILIDKDGRVIVSDFGIARAMEEKSLTASGTVIGTPHFMSPEQCGGQRVGPQSDQYSLGVLGFQMLSGQVPFDSDSMIGIIQHHYFTPVPDVTKVRQGVPPELLAVIYKALEKKADARYETTQEMARALAAVPISDADKAEGDRILRSLSHGERIPKVRTGSLPPLATTSMGQAPITSPPIPQRERVTTEKKGKGTLIAAGLVALLLVGGGGAMMLRKSAAPAPAPVDAGATGTVATPTPTTTAPAPTPTGGDQTGMVEFTGAPRGARITVDGHAISGTSSQLAVGQHRYIVTAPGVRPASGSFVVKASDISSVPLNMGAPSVAAAPTTDVPAPAAAAGPTGKLRVAAEPIEAQIFVDGKLLGTGRVVDAPIPAGSHRLRITASGYETLEESFTVDAGEAKNLSKKTLKSTSGTP